jgi:hypothetical protein
MNDEDRAFINDSDLDPAPRKRKSREHPSNPKKQKREGHSPLPGLLDALKDTPVNARKQQSGKSKKKASIVELDSSSDDLDGIESVHSDELVPARPKPVRTRSKIKDLPIEKPVHGRGQRDISPDELRAVKSLIDGEPISTRNRQLLIQTNTGTDTRTERPTRRRGEQLDNNKETNPVTKPTPYEMHDSESEEDVDLVSAQLDEYASKPIQETRLQQQTVKPIAPAPIDLINSRGRQRSYKPAHDAKSHTRESTIESGRDLYSQINAREELRLEDDRQDDESSDIDLYEAVYAAPHIDPQPEQQQAKLLHEADDRKVVSHEQPRIGNDSCSGQSKDSEDSDDDFGLDQYIRQPAPELVPPRSRSNEVPHHQHVGAVAPASGGGTQQQSTNAVEADDGYDDDQDCELT